MQRDTLHWLAIIVEDVLAAIVGPAIAPIC